jgi:hypothetical protein
MQADVHIKKGGRMQADVHIKKGGRMQADVHIKKGGSTLYKQPSQALNEP